MTEKIGILTGGGDCPGLNAVIRSVTKTSLKHGWEVIGFEDGFRGVVEGNFRFLSDSDVSGILTHGGTILGTSNTANPFRFPEIKKGKLVLTNRINDALGVIKELSLKALVCIGGDGTLTIAHSLSKLGVPVVGVPKTIDNDLCGTEFTFGFDSAVSIATDATDRLHTTAASHHRVMVLEVMGRYAGWLALYAGAAGGADVILIPEIPYQLKKVSDHILSRLQRGKHFSIVVVGEGAREKGGKMIVERKVKASTDPVCLGGVGQYVGTRIEKMTGIETRVSVLGHIQRGGSPTPHDRNLGTLFGSKAVELIQKKKMGHMAAIQKGKVTSVSLKQAIRNLKLVPLKHPLLLAGRSVGTSFGD